MATMIPRDIDRFTTEGEERFFKFLAAVAKPDDRYLAWYLPDIDGNEPDFILFSPEVGLVVFEVKDWALGQVMSADPHHFALDMGGRVESKKNPLRQGREYCERVVERLKEDGRLVSADPLHHGNPRVPVAYGVVFPNINKHEYVEKGFDRVIPAGHTFFWDDLHPQSDISSDASGRVFGESLRRMFPPRFPFHLAAVEISVLRQVIFPSVRIALPERPGSAAYEAQAQRLRVLDHNQEAIARKYDGGHRILTGPSGSGKTVVLAHKAAFLRRYNRAVQSVLFVCYNITLVNYIKRLLAELRVPLGEGAVEVVHFFELCSRVTGERFSYDAEGSTYYDMIVEEALTRVGDYGRRYDAVLVDEGQDFSDDMYRVVVSLVKAETNSLTIALDENQNIYRRKQKWKDVGVKAQGRVHRLSSVYRNTEEITRLARRFINQAPSPETAAPAQGELFDRFFECHGPEPEVRQFSDLGGMESFIAERALALHEKEGYPLSEIAVIYAVRHPRGDEKTLLPHLFGAALESRGVMWRWASEDSRSKQSFDITTNSVAITTIHSAKGLDFACVFLVGLDLVTPGETWTADQIRSLAYVGMTRARYRLFIPYVEKTAVIESLLASV